MNYPKRKEARNRLFLYIISFPFDCRAAFAFLVFNFSFLISFSQIWYFGNGAGLKFTSSGVQPLFDGKIYTNEGCAVACDENGKLIFYTDGMSVWDSHHELLKNGTGLLGNHSSTQSALIVQKPQDENLFYVFTVDEKAGINGLCYTMIDRNANKVVQKNIRLLARASEKITAVMHQNGKEVWVIAHGWNSNQFFSYPLSSAGIGDPIVSAGELDKEDVRHSIGYLRASNDGKKLAMAIGYKEENNLTVFDFDNVTGKISNRKLLSLKGFLYGVCFSPDNSKLYVSLLTGKAGIIQYDLSSNKTSELCANEKENSFGGLQLGYDRKIYVAHSGTYLDIITQPDGNGKECGYQKNAISLCPASSAFGLPNDWNAKKNIGENLNCEAILMKSPISMNRDFYPGISTCEKEMFLDAKNSGASYLWSTESTCQKIKIDTSGVYKVKVRKGNCVIADSVKIIFKKDLAVFRYLPVFNPDNGFINTEFYYSIDEVDAFELTVFDKKKAILFHTKNPEVKWGGMNLKGEVVNAGEYAWEVSYKPLCPINSAVVKKSGAVRVKRAKK
ncbi:MAG TPA: hypothetical protein VII99_15500 [Bacteroidia bacterium]